MKRKVGKPVLGMSAILLHGFGHFIMQIYLKCLFPRGFLSCSSVEMVAAEEGNLGLRSHV